MVVWLRVIVFGSCLCYFAAQLRLLVLVCFLLIVIEFVDSLGFAFGRLVSCVSLVSSRSLVNLFFWVSPGSVASFRSEHLRVALFRRKLLHRPRILIIFVSSIFLDFSAFCDSSLIYDFAPEFVFVPGKSCTKNAEFVRSVFLCPPCEPLQSLHNNNAFSIVENMVRN